MNVTWYCHRSLLRKVSGSGLFKGPMKWHFLFPNIAKSVTIKCKEHVLSLPILCREQFLPFICLILSTAWSGFSLASETGVRGLGGPHSSTWSWSFLRAFFSFFSLFVSISERKTETFIWLNQGRLVSYHLQEYLATFAVFSYRGWALFTQGIITCPPHGVNARLREIRVYPLISRYG